MEASASVSVSTAATAVAVAKKPVVRKPRKQVPKIDAATANVDLDRQIRIAELFKLRVNTGLKTSGAKHALVPPDCLHATHDCTITQTQAKNDYALDKDELALMNIRQNKKRRFYCGTQLDAISIHKYGFDKFLKKKYRNSAGVKTAENNLVELRKLEEGVPREDCLEAARNAVAFLDLKARACQASFEEASRQFAADFPEEAEGVVPAPKANSKLVKKAVKAATATLKQKFKERLAKARAASKARPKKRKQAAKAKGRKPAAKKSGVKSVKRVRKTASE